MAERTSRYRAASAKLFKKGLIQIFTGEGKGKTSAALGTVLRALGHGLRVCLVAFMKGDYPYGEWETLAQLPNIKVARFGFRTFTNPAKVRPQEIKQAKEALAFAREAMLSGSYDLIVLDEVNVAIAWRLLELAEVVKLIQDKPPKVELILTGRYADAKLVALADLVTECVKIKHPYDKGIKARPGIEY